MRIHSLEINNVRAVEHLALHDLPETGVILIHGDNEAGKSTILDALDAVLTIKHTSTVAKVRALNPKGRDETPEVTVSATVGPYNFTIFKRFGGRSKGKAELKITAPRHEELAGEEAENRLSEIVGEHVDQQLFDALFLRQGDFTRSVEAAGIPTFTRALEASGDGGGESGMEALEDTGLLKRVDDEYNRFFTPKGNEKQPLKEADAAVAEAEEKVRDAKAAKARHDADVDEYARNLAEIETIEAELPGAEDELSQREKEAKAAAELNAKRTEAKDKADRAAGDVERAQKDNDYRRDRITRAEEAALVLGNLNEQLEPLKVKAQAEQDEIEAKEEELLKAKAAADTLRAAAVKAEEALATARAGQRRAELEELVGRLDEVDAEITRLIAAQPAAPVTDDDVRALEQAVGEVAVQQRILEEAASRIEITGPDGATITVDGKDTELADGSPASIPLHDGTQLTLADYTLTFRAAAGADTATTALEEAQAEVDRLVASLELGETTSAVETARTLRDQHRQLAGDLEAARSRWAELLRGREADELRAELARMEDLSSESDSGDATALTVEEAQQVVDDARRDADEARDTAHTIEAQLAGLRERRAKGEMVALTARIEAQKDVSDRALGDLEAERGKHTDEQLKETLETTLAAQKNAAEALEEIDGLVAEADPDGAVALRDGARNRVDNLKARHRAASDMLLKLDRSVTSAEGEAERLDHAEADLEAVRVKRDRLRRQAEAIKLLRTTLHAHRDAARAKYAAPFATALQRYASRIFGQGTEFTLDDSLRVEARTVDGTTVDIDQLSGGAKEQMALLTRFAIADMVATGNDETVPVFIDDALGATDPQRLALMNSLFTQVGQSSQVFVLTCFPQRFDRVAATRTASIRELKGAY